MARRDDQRGPDEWLGLRIAALVAIAGGAYLGLQIALNVWKSWLLAGSVVALAFALLWLVFPDTSDDA